jgi:hypothetical protein
MFAQYCSKRTMLFIFCFVGLQASYLTWGFMQELVMTTKFRPTKLAPDGFFPSSAFCVFINRIAAMVVAWYVMSFRVMYTLLVLVDESYYIQTSKLFLILYYFNYILVF